MVPLSYAEGEEVRHEAGGLAALRIAVETNHAKEEEVLTQTKAPPVVEGA